MGMLKVLNPGLFSTFQDLGRYGYEAFGVSNSGPMDAFSHRVANLLLKNEKNASVLEMTMVGGEFSFDRPTFITITGAPVNATLNGNQIQMWEAIEISSGDTLNIGPACKGCRVYLGGVGGFSLDSKLGSVATHVRSKMGGHQGRKLERGDEISYGTRDLTDDEINNIKKRRLSLAYRPSFEDDVVVRIMKGPQEDAFNEDAFLKMTGSAYEVSNQFDRMGYRMLGTELSHKKTPDIISDGLLKGAIQVPGDGQPIIMMADCQTTGGYTKIAQTISVDLDKVGQLKAGDKIRFEWVSLEDAQLIRKAWLKKFDEMALSMEGYEIKEYRIRVGSSVYDVCVTPK